MAVLVTGGMGYIGSHTVVELLNQNYEVIVADNLSNSKAIVKERIEAITGKSFVFYNTDVTEEAGLEKIFMDNAIEAVIHFAAFKAVGESVEKPLEYYFNNLTSTLITLKVMKKYGVKNFIFSSSATVYGQANIIPIPEDYEPLSATNPYGRAKLMTEDILRDMCKTDKSWNIAILRYFNPVGAHESGSIGEDPNGIPNNLMPYITKVAIGELPELKVFGNDYDTKDGTGVRDYIHVVDLAKGHISALKKIMENSGLITYNLGTGKGYSVLEIVEAFSKASNKTLPYSITSRRPGDIAVCYADPTKANEEMGWKAEKDINEMCRDSWRWQSQNPKGYEDK